MASKLCCTAEQEGRPNSPELPNARPSQLTSANLPLLSKQQSPPGSRFTSARSDELLELRNLFHNAQDQDRTGSGPSPPHTPRARLSRTSMHSLSSLHKMTSMRSIIRQKFSKDLRHKDPAVSPIRSKVKGTEPDTVVKQPRVGPNQQLKITKNDLRRDLLSDKKPDQGGYDSDAEILDDIAKNIGRKTPCKRPSIRSIEWTPSMGSKPTPGSSTQGRNSAEIKPQLASYHIQKPPTVSFSARFSHVFSTPNLRSDTSDERDRTVRRSHSATSMGLPKPSSLSPLRLPSLTTYDKDGVPWSEVLNESLRLTQFPVPPRHISPIASQTMSDITHNRDEIKRHTSHQENIKILKAKTEVDYVSTAPVRAIEIRLQQPTSITTPRTSMSVRGILRDVPSPSRENQAAETKGSDESDNPRRSVHLHTMRISHHLRSGSLLSWDQLADTSELPPPPRPFRERSVSDQSRSSHMQRQIARHERQTSSSGFASSRVPSKWGKVLPNNGDLRADVASSIYSSRPQSPPDSFGGSIMNLAQNGAGHNDFSISPIDIPKPRRSNSFPTDNEDTPRPAQRYTSNSIKPTREALENAFLTTPAALARKNSVADTKKSKFREEFSPTPPKKKLTPSTSIMKFLNSKRLSMRSQSEANLWADSPSMGLDGLFDPLPIPDDQERRRSHSMISLQIEQEALGKSRGANAVWDRALKAHQEEKASLFLPKNRDLAVQASPFRERSGSTTARQPSLENNVETVSSAKIPVHSSDHSFRGSSAPEASPALISRRSALAGRIDTSPECTVSALFERLGDSPDIVGAWGRYPSHTRHDRTFSAGKVDRVETRDFALEAAIRFASAKNDTHNDDYLIGPTERLPSPPLLPGEKKRKKKIGKGRMSKSNSMTFGKTFSKNYSKIFRSQSTEFRKHGRGHRSSIASGGILEFPELELLPDVWACETVEEQDRNAEHFAYHHHMSSDANGKSKLRMEESMATLRPRRNSSAPNLHELAFRDGADDSEHTQDRARVWSVYYEDCIPSFPRLSTEASLRLEGFGPPPRLSFDGKLASLHSRTFPTRTVHHSRNASQLSRASVMSRGSVQPSSMSMSDGDAVEEESSFVSVRRSTMDLISKFREQEIAEHNTLLALTRMESRREREAITSL